MERKIQMETTNQSKEKTEKPTKRWKKPVFITIRASELQARIKAAAYSGGGCFGHAR